MKVNKIIHQLSIQKLFSKLDNLKSIIGGGSNRWQATTVAEELDNIKGCTLMKRTLLWTNPDITASMSATAEITLSSDDYDELEIFYEFKCDSTIGGYGYERMKPDTYHRLNVLGDGYIGHRKIYASGATISSTEVKYNNSTNTSYAIPVEIYGIKYN